MQHKHPAMKMLARNGWRRADGVRLLLAVVAAVVATLPAWVDMAAASLSSDIARPSVLVLPIMAWLIWVRRARFRNVRPGGYSLGWIILVSGAQLYFVGHYAYGLRSPWHIGAVMLVAGAILVCTGKSAFKQFLPAWLLLPFVVPVPDTLALLIAQPIQLFEAHSIAWLYGLLGVPVEVFSRPVNSLMVVGGEQLLVDNVCKGLPTMMSLVLICYGFVFGSPMRPSVRAGILLAAPFVALLCSASALCATLWLYNGHSSPMTADLIRSMTQWGTLLLAFLLITVLLRMLAWASVPVYQYNLASTAA